MFIQFACTNLDGSQKQGGGGFKFASERGGYPKRWGFPQKRGGGGGVQPWRKLRCTGIKVELL